VSAAPREPSRAIEGDVGVGRTISPHERGGIVLLETGIVVSLAERQDQGAQGDRCHQVTTRGELLYSVKTDTPAFPHMSFQAGAARGAAFREPAARGGAQADLRAV